MQQPRRNIGVVRTGIALAAALVLALASYAVAAEPKGPRSKSAAPNAAPQNLEVGEMLYGAGGGAWGSPSRTAARLARQREVNDKAATQRVAEYDRQPIQPAAPTVRPVFETPSLLPLSEEPGRMAQWLIPLGGGILIGLGVAGIYSWNRSRGMMGTASGRLLVVSVGSAVSVFPGNSLAHMGTIPKPSRRRGSRRSRPLHSHMMSFPKLRIRPSRDLQGDALRQLQTLGILPIQLGELTPGTGRPSWFASAVTDDLQMYGGGSDPIPNCAYLEDAPRMLAQVEHQKLAEAMVWSNQHWQR